MAGDAKKARLRFPTLEVYGIRLGAAFATTERPLKPREQALAKPIFEASIDLDVVRIVQAPVVNAPTTLANYIRIGNTPMPDATLIHELTHIWQFQNKGTAYMSNSLCGQAGAWIKSGFKSRNGAYSVGALVSGKAFHEYSAEQQAVIVETYFANPKIRNDPVMKKLIAEVRKARPQPRNVRL